MQNICKLLIVSEYQHQTQPCWRCDEDIVSVVHSFLRMFPHLRGLLCIRWQSTDLVKMCTPQKLGSKCAPPRLSSMYSVWFHITYHFYNSYCWKSELTMLLCKEWNICLKIKSTYLYRTGSPSMRWFTQVCTRLRGCTPVLHLGPYRLGSPWQYAE